jgi:hypothetical protein
VGPKTIPTTTKTLPFINQLFLYSDAAGSDSCGAIYLTQKGNIIFNAIEEQADTVRYFWGTYSLTDSTLTYRLTDEYYYYGQWDERWDVPDPHYAKGKTRKIKSTEVTLFKLKFGTYPFFQLCSKQEKKQADTIPSGFIYQAYYETKEMKFYTWFYKQIPVLANL